MEKCGRIYSICPAKFLTFSTMIGSILFVLQNSWHFQTTDDVNWHDFRAWCILSVDQNSGILEFVWPIFQSENQLADHWILPRILVDWLSIQKFRWLSNSSQLRWPQNYFEILQGFWSDIFLKIKWPRNSYEILQGFWSEFWLSAIVSNNSDDYEILQELDDHGIFVKFFQDLIRILVASQFR